MEELEQEIKRHMESNRGDVILERGTNSCGSYAKFKSGIVLMTGSGSVFPIECVRIPYLRHHSVYMSYWF